MSNSGPSPNLRLSDTNDAFHQAQQRVADELGLRLGSWGVTADIMVAALLRVCDTEERFPDLVEAVRQERLMRGKR